LRFTLMNAFSSETEMARRYHGDSVEVLRILHGAQDWPK